MMELFSGAQFSLRGDTVSVTGPFEMFTLAPGQSLGGPPTAMQTNSRSDNSGSGGESRWTLGKKEKIIMARRPCLARVWRAVIINPLIWTFLSFFFQVKVWRLFRAYRMKLARTQAAFWIYGLHLWVRQIGRNRTSEPQGGTHLKVNDVQIEILKIRTLLENQVRYLPCWQ